MVINWADKVSKWPIQRIIPCHLANDIKATAKDFRKAFQFLEVAPSVAAKIRPGALGKILH